MQTFDQQSVNHTGPRTGFSLAEVVVSSLLLAVMSLGAVTAIGHVFETWAVQRDTMDGSGLARELMNEILQAEYIDSGTSPVFGLEADEGVVPNLRSEFDDVDDFHGWTSNPPRERDDATPMASLTGWQRDVAVEWVQLNSPTTVSVMDSGLKRITVTVTAPDSTVTQMVGFRSQWGILQQNPAADSTIVTGVYGTLQIGQEVVRDGVALVNHAQD